MPRNGYGAQAHVGGGLIVSSQQGKPITTMHNQIKTCPHCRSEINALATKCPHCQSDVRTPWQKHKLWVILLGSIVLVIITAAITSSGGSPAVTAPAPVTAKPVVQNPSFDVPALVGKNIDQITQMLGTPSKEYEPTAQQKQLGVNEGDKTFTKDGNTLLITYTVTTRKVVDFFISTNDPNGTTTDTESLLKIGNLKQTDPKYTIELVKSLKVTGAYTGVKVIPKN